MNERPLCSIGAISYELGSPVPLTELGELAGDPAGRQLLLDGGLSRVAVSEATSAELARRCLRRTLAESGLAPDDVDLVVYASNRFDGPAGEPTLQTILAELQLTRALPLGLGLAGCSNAVVALRIAANALAAGSRHALIVSTDAVGPTGARVLPEHASLLGDGAVSFVVSPAGARDFDVLGTAFHSAPLLASLRMSEPAFLVGSVNASRQVIRDVLRDAGIAGSELCLATANNFRRPIVRTLLGYSGLSGVPLYEDNLSRFAHCQAADALIGLCDASRDGRIPVGSAALVLTNTFFLWGAVVVKSLSG